MIVCDKVLAGRGSNGPVLSITKVGARPMSFTPSNVKGLESLMRVNYKLDLNIVVSTQILMLLWHNHGWLIEVLSFLVVIDISSSQLKTFIGTKL